MFLANFAFKMLLASNTCLPNCGSLHQPKYWTPIGKTVVFAIADQLSNLPAPKLKTLIPFLFSFHNLHASWVDFAKPNK